MLSLLKSFFEGLETILQVFFKIAIAILKIPVIVLEGGSEILSGIFKPAKGATEKVGSFVAAIIVVVLLILGFSFKDTTCTAVSCVCSGCQGLDRSWSAYLGSDDSSDNGTSSTEASTITGNVAVKVADARVRKGPGYSHKVLVTLHKGDTVTLTGDFKPDGKKVWRKVTLPDGKPGWMLESLLDLQSSSP